MLLDSFTALRTVRIEATIGNKLRNSTYFLADMLLVRGSYVSLANRLTQKGNVLFKMLKKKILTRKSVSLLCTAVYYYLSVVRYSAFVR